MILDFQVGLLLKALVMGIVEGLTEFLPVSSTGHLIVVGSLLNFDSEKAKVFDIAIQTGAILALMMVYRARLMTLCQGALQGQVTSQKVITNVAIAFAPCVVLGLWAGKAIQAHLLTPWVVATTFIVGGLVMLWVERGYPRHSSNNSHSNDGSDRRYSAPSRSHTLEEISPQQALLIGLTQCLALIPGTSRSAASIIGGMCVGLSRQVAVEFSFFLAMPTLLGAGAYSLYKARHDLVLGDLPLFGIGLVAAFLSAWWVVRWFLRYVSHHHFGVFAIYRIGFGLLILGFMFK
jgi:undecaprenyl-diphosphatase